LLQYKSITRADYARFLCEYLRATARNAEDWRSWFPDLSRRAISYNRRARLRKAGKLDGYSG
jgi:hypothetical protein